MWLGLILGKRVLAKKPFGLVPPPAVGQSHAREQMMKTSAELEKQAALQVAALMAAAARTAPKTRGIDNIRVVAIDDGPTKQQVRLLLLGACKFPTHW